MYNLLNGLTVIEGSAFVAGPSCGLYLAQMGATVIRFDQIGGGLDAKRWPLSPDGGSLFWEGLNKNKRSIAIDLSCEQGKELAQRLAVSADGLFITNFPESGFLSYEALSALREDLICLRIMGWADGTPAVDYTINPAIGMPAMTGPADSDQPVNHVLPAWDLMAGTYGAFALLAAERERAASGRGREVRVALSDMAAVTMANLGALAEVLSNNADRPRYGNDLFGAFGRDFLTADGQRIMIVALSPRQWTSLVSVLDISKPVAALENTLGVSFKREQGARFEHRDKLLPWVADAITARTLGELASDFDATGVCWSRYQTLSQAYRDEPRFYTGNPIFSDVSHPSGQTYPTPGSVARIAGEECGAAGPAPVIGQHTDEILATLLGMSDTEIGKLHDRKIVE